MANVHVISVRLVDDAGRTGTTNVFVPATLSVAQVQSFLDLLLPALDTVTGAKIDAASVALGMTLPGSLKASAVANCPMQQGANFAFDVANTPYRFTMHVPAVDYGIINGEEIDTAPAYVQNFLTYMVTGDGTAAPTDRYGNDITALLDALVAFRKA